MRDADAANTLVDAIALDTVTVRYRGAVALDRVSLSVAPGEIRVLLGPSGSGKSTILRAIAGFVPLASGRILLAGRDVTALPPHARGLGMVVQNYALFPHLTVAANVGFGLSARRLPKREIAERVAGCLDLVGMSAFIGRYPRELSGGQQQRVAIARALAIRPP
ncbi:MAG TPA: ATP-binding cassette domain-containing protein, partial [Acidiphilium sp.]|nr:ATP-binding cassette domain-containing protein [Acidiphilium sp.]